MKKTSIIIIVSILAANITGCASTPINTNCVTISAKKVENPNYLPSKGTAIGAGVGVGTGAIVGGVAGLIAGFVAGIASSFATGPFGPIFFPIFGYTLAGGAAGAGIGALAGLTIGGASGYAYDYNQNKNGLYRYDIACGNPNGQKFYAISNNKLVVESGPDTLHIDTLQAYSKQTESSGTPVNLFSNSDGYYVEKQDIVK
ncbi:MAG: hypothetical protein ACK5Z5_01385 [Neisseriaceae bacterium]|jgi:hypothetical protein